MQNIEQHLPYKQGPVYSAGAQHTAPRATPCVTSRELFILPVLYMQHMEQLLTYKKGTFYSSCALHATH